MNLKEACKHALTILKQVMEEKLNETNVEVRFSVWKDLAKHKGSSECRSVKLNIVYYQSVMCSQ